MKSLSAKFLRFGIVGIVAAASYALLAYIFIWTFGWSELISSALAYLLAIPISFFGQKYVTFSSNGAVKTEARRFVMLQVFCLLATMLITTLSSKVFNLHPNIGILAVCVLLPPISFGVMSAMIFTDKVKG